MFSEMLHNRVLIPMMIAWLLGQFLKAPLEYIINRQWKWGVMFSAGGFPSTHSALVTCASLSIGLREGFSTALFALSVAIAMVVVYDAAGVRQEAGKHARLLNEIVTEIFEGHQIPEKKLKEVLGHTPVEAISGIFLGVTVALVYWLLVP